MKDELSYLLGRTARGHISRRAFMGRAAALGVSAALANTMLAQAVRVFNFEACGHLEQLRDVQCL